MAKGKRTEWHTRQLATHAALVRRKRLRFELTLRWPLLVDVYGDLFVEHFAQRHERNFRSCHKCEVRRRAVEVKTFGEALCARGRTDEYGRPCAMGDPVLAAKLPGSPHLVPSTAADAPIGAPSGAGACAPASCALLERPLEGPTATGASVSLRGKGVGDDDSEGR